LCEYLGIERILSMTLFLRGSAATMAAKAAAIAVMCFLPAACSSVGSQVGIATSPGVVSDPALHPGDAVRVQVWRESDLSGTFEVDDRGIVVLPLLGERAVTGLSPDDLRDTLLEDYAEYLQNPSVQVTLLRRINILGEVRSPGLYPVDATISLADALAMAGGITPNGSPDDIRLIRGGSGHPGRLG
jgi:polysaccharide export outer membrane protein